MFNTGLNWHAQQLAKAAGQPVTYETGSASIPVPDAILGKSEYESEDGTGTKIRAIVSDWLIGSARIPGVEPQPGHRIIQTIGTTTVTFEVQNLGPEGCYRFSGPTRDRYRIHTREIPSS